MNCTKTLRLYLLVLGSLSHGILCEAGNATHALMGTSTTDPTEKPTIHLSPRPIASVEIGHPLKLTMNILSDISTSWRLEWSKSNTGVNGLGSVTSFQITTCQESARMSDACLLNSTLVRFYVNNANHGDVIYCAVFIPGSWTSDQTRLTTFTRVYVYVPVESVRLQSSSGEISEGRLIVKEGDNFTLQCDTSLSRPAATISWIKDSVDTSWAGSKPTVSNIDGLFWTSQTLTILAERDHRSAKTFIVCNAVNGKSNATSSTLEIITLSEYRQPSTVTIEHYPVLRPTPVSVDYLNKADVRLSWSIEPESLYRVSFDMVIVPDTAGLTVGPPTRRGGVGVLFSSKFTGLQPNQIYKVSVSAFNDLGSSDVTTVFFNMASDETEAGLPYFLVGLTLIVVAVVMLSIFGVIGILMKGGYLVRIGKFCGLKSVCYSREDEQPDTVYQDLENLGRTDAIVIEKRLRKARKGDCESKANLGLVSGVYNSIALSIGMCSDNIYDDIPAAESVRFCSSGFGSAAAAEAKVTLSVPKANVEKKKPPILKKPPSRKYKESAAGQDNLTQEPNLAETPSNQNTDTPEKGCLSEIKEDVLPENVTVHCEYMEMRVPQPPKENEYVDVQRTRKEPVDP
ncbi:uncharacterized protein LOC132547844 [Ylistrum balloti]|uniref:uncharacterized protein LOC132547844 n=1 Tax=Ylistrum balloti TaxID=509963 RepID=UPI002905D881|nr:uncharacterized protein LOC132547844 [Ylistrum balloti]